MRTLWVVVFIISSTLVHALGAILAALFGVPRRPGGVYDWATVDWSRRILQVAGTPVRAVGLERIPVTQPVVYASNHTSMFDIWALAGTLPGSTRFVAKQELGRIPILGLAMRRAGHVLIDRQNRTRAFEAVSYTHLTLPTICSV